MSERSEQPEQSEQMEYGSFEAAAEKSRAMEADIPLHPQRYRVLTGDRPTGRLHIGHYFGSLQNRARLARLGVTTYIVIADYQVLTDRVTFEAIAENTRELTIDYIASGILPGPNTHIFPHSHVPELNQLLLPFLTLVTNAELNRNPTVKEEIAASGMKNITAGMYTYPVHQAADILFCKGNTVPVGKDQLPHLELTRVIARRFNERFAAGKPVFPEPQALLSAAPTILGLDGGQKMSKSRNNAIMLCSSEDETAALLKKAKTDSDRNITFDPEKRPEVSNLLLLASLCTGEAPASIAARIGDQGSGTLKRLVTEALNEYFRPIRAERTRLEADPAYITGVLRAGIENAREIGVRTLAEVRAAMHMEL
jgi:tryptophanyl-tRNA synthetase